MKIWVMFRIGLPTTMNDHERRHHNEEIGVDNARWTKLNTEKISGDCILEAKDISSTSWGKMRFVDLSLIHI